jgi:ankyrin repeat protein
MVQEIGEAQVDQVVQQLEGMSVEEIQFELRDACRYGEIDTVQQILSSGIKGLESIITNSKSLLYASANGHCDILNVLLPLLNPTLVNQSNEEGNTPLHWAALNGQTNAVKLLLQHGADPVKRNNAGLSPATLADMREHLETSSVIVAAYDSEDEDDEEDEEKKGESSI